jgi:hypothetical protein
MKVTLSDSIFKMPFEKLGWSPGWESLSKVERVSLDSQGSHYTPDCGLVDAIEPLSNLDMIYH